jgi:hypothetical protein
MCFVVHGTSVLCRIFPNESCSADIHLKYDKALMGESYYAYIFTGNHVSFNR